MMEKILFLPRWYPNRYDEMPGLFIRKLAESVSLHHEITVLYVHRDEQAKENYELVSSIENGLHIIRVYYRGKDCRIPLLSSFLNAMRFYNAEMSGLRSLDLTSFSIVHVHVLTRQGLVALLLRVFKGKPYIITEHWSRYFKGNNTYKGLLRKLITRIVVRQAAGVTVVSEKLKTAMISKGLTNQRFIVIPNSFDSREFHVKGEKQGLSSRVRIIHVSCFEEKSKNISGFLRTLEKLSRERQDFHVNMVGDGPELEYWKEYALELGLREQTISFPGLKTHEELCCLFNDSDFLVLSSNYETFGTVLIEAMACGLPVVSTDVGIAPSVINKETGLLAATGDESSLFEAIAKMLDIYNSYNRVCISESVKRFEENTVTAQLLAFYKEAINQ